MKTPDEIKKGLECCPGQYSASCGKCPYGNDGKDCGRNGVQIMKDALAYIQQLEAKFSQVSKALCGKENATLDEVLQVIDQVKVELAFVTLERDALFSEIKQCNDCYFCKHYGTRIDVEPCQTCILDYQQQDFKPGFEWRGVCPENTEVQDGNQ